MKNVIQQEWVTAKDAHFKFGVNRSWLRDKWGEGKIRRKGIAMTMWSGEHSVKYLYSVADIRKELGQ